MDFLRQTKLLQITIILGIVWLCGASPSFASDSKPEKVGIKWQPWSDSIFDQASREHKFVLLDLQAVWCHWCHVMDEKTYSDPKIIALIQSRYIAVRVDQDSRPDLANRYQDYGWPATVVFNGDGSEIVKRQGFIPPDDMASMLQAIIDDPSPGPSVTNTKPVTWSGSASLVDLATLEQQLLNGYDSKLGAWGTVQKFLNWGNVEYCLVRAQAGDADAEKMARQTLDAQLKLVDPVWGGVDQYSAEGDWDHPHFEKIMQIQAENMRIYAEAYAQWKEPVYLQTAQGIYRYVRAFLTSPDGVVYVSQDADLMPGEHAGDYFKLDDAGRRKLGLPRIDTHIYARENGWFIEALTTLYAATGDFRYRDEAASAAEWVIQHRAIQGGGFRHGDETSGPISLGDTLAMGRAFLGLYAVTGNQAWLDRAQQSVGFISTHFSFNANGYAIGFATAAAEPAAGHFKPEPDFDENVSLARFANLLFRFTGSTSDQQIAQTAIRYPGAPELAQARFSAVGGLLLAESELNSDPLHIAIVGKKDDDTGSKLFATALAFPIIYKQVEWIDPEEKTSIPDAAIYPEMPQSAAYVCANHACSAPVFDDAHLVEMLQRRTTPQAVLPAQSPVKSETSVAVSSTGSDTFAGNRSLPVAPGVPETQPILLAVLGAAFVGGLILNLMPCVLPVLSLKVFSLIRHAGEKSGAWKQGVAFTMGVVVSFWVLAGLLLILRTAGSHLGWGFQMQSPGFVLALIILFFVLALNLFGVFELGSSLVGLDAKATSHSGGYASSFGNGALATLAATPCTGPFMGSALGFAAQQPAFVSILIFTFLALGMATPYLLLTIFPGALRFVPKPGAWMEAFKQFMGFLLMATVIFLVYIFGALVGADNIPWLMGSLLLVGLATWIYGRWFTPIHSSATRAIALVLVVAILGYAIHWDLNLVATPLFQPSVTANASTSPGDSWQTWSQQAVDAALAQNRPVFVDFSAAWCLTCKVNERVALEDDSVKQAFGQKNVALFRADWTHSDPAISKTLQDYHRDGVPLYLLYKPGDKSSPAILPAVLTPGVVLDSLNQL